jgi:hypothetical protein
MRPKRAADAVIRRIARFVALRSYPRSGIVSAVNEQED